MNRIKVAQELVKLARELTAGDFAISFDEGNLTDAIFNGVALEVHFTGDKADARKLAKEIIQATKKYAPKE